MKRGSTHSRGESWIDTQDEGGLGAEIDCLCFTKRRGPITATSESRCTEEHRL